MDISFTKVRDVSEQYSPKPATEFVPTWYKEVSSYVDKGLQKLSLIHI